jgi:glycosyltransferase involved in cell wall biosynthesis
MKVLALIEKPADPCYRYRIEAFAWALAERGLFLEVATLDERLPRRVAQLLAAGFAHVVVLQRKLLPRWQLSLLRASARRLIYDVDDAVFGHDSFSPKGPWSSSRLARFRATVRAADAVTAGNHYLRQHALASTDRDRVHVVPTCVEPTWYEPAEHHRAGAASRMVWIGQRSTMASLALVREHLAAIADALPGVELRVVSDGAPDPLGMRVTIRSWSSATEAAELAAADIGIAWLPEDGWSCGKCGLKVLQYMAAGLPVVTNPVGMNSEMVIPGVTGFLATTPAEWAQAIAWLAAHPDARRRMGGAARQFVQDHYCASTWAPRVASLIDAVARDGWFRPSEGQTCRTQRPALLAKPRPTTYNPMTGGRR